MIQLYEEVVVDNERLRRQLQKTEEDLLEARITIEKQSVSVSIKQFLIILYSIDMFVVTCWIIELYRLERIQHYQKQKSEKGELWRENCQKWKKS